MAHPARVCKDCSIYCLQVELLHHLHLVYEPLLQELTDKDMAEFLKLTLEHMPDVKELPNDITRAKIELLQKTIATKLFCSDGMS